MPHSADCPEGRSQHFTFSRRGLLQRLAAFGLPLLASSVHPAVISPTTAKRPLPEFKLGDLISCDWTDSEFCENYTEFGEIVGACRLPDDSWVYYINWTHGTSSDDFQYPCFETEPTTADRLRLVKHD